MLYAEILPRMLCAKDQVIINLLLAKINNIVFEINFLAFPWQVQ